MFGRCALLVLLKVISVWTTEIKHRYILFNVERTWMEAKLICEQDNMVLVKIETFQENKFIKDLVNTNTGPAVNTWSGLHRDTVSQEKWTDGTTPIFANYGQETPTSNGGTFCFTLRASDGFWIEKDCNQRYMFVCKMNIGSCTFENRGANSGCKNGNLAKPTEILNTHEVSEAQCKDICLTSANSNNVECWAAAHYPDYAGNDCWLFFTRETDYCELNQGVFGGVTLFLKHCFEGGVSTLTTDIETKVDTTEPVTPDKVTEIISTINERISPDTTDPITTSTAGGSTPFCTCFCQSQVLPEELQQKIDKLVSDIKIDRKSTSQYKRKLISAPDGRISSRVIGVSGIIILSFVCVFIFSIDIMNIYSAFRMLFRRMKNV